MTDPVRVGKPQVATGLEHAVGAGAPSAEKLVLEEGEVVCGDRVELPVPEALTATHARCALRLCYRGGNNVLAAAALVLEVPAFAKFSPPADDDLVDGGGVVLAGDEPNTVLESNLFSVLAVELLAAKDAGGDAGDVLEVGGGWVRGLR
jgi:hypothetical protein